MRDEYVKFTARGVEILAVGPNDQRSFQRYWMKERIPFIGLPDPAHKVAGAYRQKVKLFKLGRMPLVCVIDRSGMIRYVHYGNSMSDIPTNKTLLDVIDELSASSE